MAKTLKDFLEGYLKVKSADEQKFIDKHVTAKNPDRNGNGDDVFKGSTKAIDRRKERKGYNPGEDEKVYEALKGKQHKIDANKNGKVDAHDFHLLRKKKKVAEEAEQIDETAKIVAHLQKRYGDNIRKSHVRSAANDFGVDASKLARAVRAKLGKNMLDEEQIDELSHDTLRGYRMKAKSIADNEGGKDRTKGRDLASRKSYGGKMGGIPKAKVMAKEEADQIDEISASTKDSYAQKAGKQLPDLFNKSGKDADSARKYYNRKNTVRKIANEEAELEEKLTAKTPMGTYIKDFQKSDAPQFKGKSQKKRQVMAIAAKLSAERGGKPLNKEERLQARLGDISESHQRVMLEVFEKLNEDNKSKFLQACDTPDGVDQMLDFAINNRGE